MPVTPLIRRLLPVVLALGVAGAGLAPTPARADPDLARFLAGAAGVAILYGLLQQSRREQAQAAPAQPSWGRPPQGQRPALHRPVALPARCAVDVGGRGRAHRLYGAQCLARAGIALNRLPQRCAVDIRGRQGSRTAYSGACLDRAGYREAQAPRRR